MGVSYFTLCIRGNDLSLLRYCIETNSFNIESKDYLGRGVLEHAGEANNVHVYKELENILQIKAEIIRIIKAWHNQNNLESQSRKLFYSSHFLRTQEGVDFSRKITAFGFGVAGKVCLGNGFLQAVIEQIKSRDIMICLDLSLNEESLINFISVWALEQYDMGLGHSLEKVTAMFNSPEAIGNIVYAAISEKLKINNVFFTSDNRVVSIGDIYHKRRIYIANYDDLHYNSMDRIPIIDPCSPLGHDFKL